jgi:hypothetical protein
LCSPLFGSSVCSLFFLSKLLLTGPHQESFCLSTIFYSALL